MHPNTALPHLLIRALSLGMLTLLAATLTLLSLFASASLTAQPLQRGPNNIAASLVAAVFLL